MNIIINGLNIEFEEFGKGKPILILHNNLSGHLESLFIENNLYFKRIYLNFPGIGKSEITGLNSSDDILSIILEFINIVIKNERFLLMGHSYSAYLARGILKTMPNQIDGIAMSCPVVKPDMSKRNIPENKQYFIDEKFLSTLKEEEKEKINYLVKQDKFVYDAVKSYKDPGSFLNVDFYNKLKSTGKYSFSFQGDDITVPFEKPSLIILGRHDYIVGYKDGLTLIEKFPRASVNLLDQVGHAPYFENAPIFKSLILDWLNKVAYYEN